MNDTILTVAIEGLAVGLFTLAAGANDEVGSIMLVFMVGLWVIWIVTNSSALLKMSNAVSAIANSNK